MSIQIPRFLKEIDKILTQDIIFSSPEYVKLTPTVGKVPVKVNALAVAEQVEKCLALTTILPPHAILDKNHKN